MPQMPTTPKPDIAVRTCQQEWEDTRKLILSRMADEGLSIQQLAALFNEQRYQVHRWLSQKFSEPRASVALRLRDWANYKHNPKH